MSEEILINVTPQETRVAVVENGVLQEVHIERALSRGIVGNIYLGKIVRVLPGMQAAFVDIGLERTAFLHANDVRNDRPPGEPVSIDQLLHDGENILVQVIKDPMGTKGARLTTQITLAARYLVYLPYSSRIGISQKIEDDEVRERMRATIRSVVGEEEGGFILRTMAESAADTELKTDVIYLKRIWEDIQENRKTVGENRLIHEDLPLAIRALRDIAREDTEKIRIDSRETFQKAEEFVGKYVPEIRQTLEYYPGERPILDLYSVEDEIQRALLRKVPLKSGGYLIIDQTEAMTTIDVNTGAYVGKKNLEETLLKTNLEATQAIARQLRLRNLGGIIIIDFIDMVEDDHRRLLMRSLEKALVRDRSKVQITEMSQLGLVELTRKRTRESLEHVLCEACPVCSGRGTIKTAQTVCYEIFRDIIREARQFDGDEYRVMASQIVIDMLLDEEAEGLEKLQEFIQKPIHLQVEPLYHQEEFDVVLS
ncbi:MAG: ribonuclease G [Acidiferrobacterales bacterium]|jgi:ribonuclease G|nr:ribonuclease G [Acidiferrobacterales bacterium]